MAYLNGTTRRSSFDFRFGNNERLKSNEERNRIDNLVFRFPHPAVPRLKAFIWIFVHTGI